jgi:hypothetical protein
MFELFVVDVVAADREREVAAALRRRQILKDADEASAPVTARAIPSSSPRRVATRVRAVQR